MSIENRKKNKTWKVLKNKKWQKKFDIWILFKIRFLNMILEKIWNNKMWQKK